MTVGPVRYGFGARTLTNPDGSREWQTSLIAVTSPPATYWQVPNTGSVFMLGMLRGFYRFHIAATYTNTSPNAYLYVQVQGGDPYPASTPQLAVTSTPAQVETTVDVSTDTWDRYGGFPPEGVYVFFSLAVDAAGTLSVASATIDVSYSPSPIRDQVTAGSRKPPSQRNPEFMAARQARAIQTMAAGSMSGRVTNATLIPIKSGFVGTSGGGQIADMIFSHPGTLVDGIWSPPYRVTVDSAKLTSVHATLGTVGATATTAVVSKNGTTFATVTVPAGASVVDLEISTSVVVDDLVRAMVTSIGTGAAGLTIQVLTT